MSQNLIFRISLIIVYRNIIADHRRRLLFYYLLFYSFALFIDLCIVSFIIHYLLNKVLLHIYTHCLAYLLGSIILTIVFFNHYVIRNEFGGGANNCKPKSAGLIFF